jgi:nucleoside-diphosphate-sugar epimerase
MDRPVLVTGASGFIGRHLVAALLASGHRVRALVRRHQAADELRAAGADPIIHDLCGPALLEDAVAGVRSVFHLAGQLFRAGVPDADYERLHVDATIALLDACTRTRVEHVLLCSTTGVHGPTGLTPAREDDAGCPQNAYERTKARAEQEARRIAARTGLPLTIARPALVYGPGDLHLLGLFRAIRGGYYRVIGDGLNEIHPIYVTDLIAGLLLTANRGRADGRAYHLVGPRPVSLRALGDEIGRAVGREVSRHHLPVSLALLAGGIFEALPIRRSALPLTRSRVRFMTQQRTYDGSRAHGELGFTPAIELEAGLAQTVSWYRQQGLLN